MGWGERWNWEVGWVLEWLWVYQWPMKFSGEPMRRPQSFVRAGFPPFPFLKPVILCGFVGVWLQAPSTMGSIFGAERRTLPLVRAQSDFPESPTTKGTKSANNPFGTDLDSRIFRICFFEQTARKALSQAPSAFLRLLLFLLLSRE